MIIISLWEKALPGPLVGVTEGLDINALSQGIKPVPFESQEVETEG